VAGTGVDKDRQALTGTVVDEDRQGLRVGTNWYGRH
jgi:hypothetical protein